MIPVRLQLSGFLSYREPVEISFEDFNLACISGQNGAGKSSILDGITWALFGKARGKNEADVINSHMETAEVVLDFAYEGDLYRVQRIKPRGKTGALEFMVQDADNRWRTLTEATMRLTEDRIRKLLRLDYETFINASFFQQGKADQFTQKSPGDRKSILSNVLGLEIWESYRTQAAKTIRAQENDRNFLTGQLQNTEEELLREPEYQSDLTRLETELGHLTELQKSKSETLQAALLQEVNLINQQKSLTEKITHLRTQEKRLNESRERFDILNRERESFDLTLNAAPQVDASYQKWLADRQELERWETLAAKVRLLSEKRAVHQAAVDQKRTELQTQLNGLRQRQTEKDARERDLPEIDQQLAALVSEGQELTRQKQRAVELNEKLVALRTTASEMDVQGKAIGHDITVLEERLKRLSEAEEELCPVCRKPLSVHERQGLITDLEKDRSALDLKRRENTDLVRVGAGQLNSVVSQLNTLTGIDRQIQENQFKHSRLEARRNEITDLAEKFTTTYLPELTAVETLLQNEAYEPAARSAIQKLDEEAAGIGYDAAAHDAVRKAEALGRTSEKLKRDVENARASLVQVNREITTLAATIAADEQMVETLSAEKLRSEAELRDLQSRLPDRPGLEREVLTLKEQVGRKTAEMGGARNRLLNLASIRARQKTLTAQREDLVRQIGLLKKLEHAFSKDGVPALLIEQALPEIETQANDLLERLSNGSMSLRFETQADYKNTKRSDKKETLEIKISDATGAYREYEMYSGGEAFRINFAIRLALSRVLSHRAGSRLQTLVIDEGFGSQDADGQQRLIEAINQVKPDFQKILVITHLEELKDAFPARIDVEKTDRGSSVRVQVL